ncbi:hypothetical protein GOV03_03330 [Candidatus Woesearchaeota archaeon]|nr:hypothetical protein [Candidatus Woesearchaeota archaeon]
MKDDYDVLYKVVKIDTNGIADETSCFYVVGDYVNPQQLYDCLTTILNDDDDGELSVSSEQDILTGEFAVIQLGGSVIYHQDSLDRLLNSEEEKEE